MGISILLRAALLLLMGFFANMLPADATHLVGGELTYKYVDANGPADKPFRYVLTARVYFNKEFGSAAPDGLPGINISIDSKAPGKGRIQTVPMGRRSFEEITPTPLPGCSLTAPRVTLAIYTTTVSLPPVKEGYLATFTNAARNEGIENLNNSGGEGMTLSVDITPGSIPNSSPAFSDKALVLICLNDTSFVLNNAYDTDGDRLSYSFATPTSNSVNQSVNYRLGYSATQPFGSTGFATVDARTGLSRYRSTLQGLFLVAIDVKEYRVIDGQEVLLGTLRRDIQIVVRACGGPANTPPLFAAATLARQNFQVAEGETLDFVVAATDAPGQALTLNVSSILLDGPGLIEATFAGQPGSSSAYALGAVAVQGTGAVTGAFRLKANCGLARATPYDVIATVADEDCNSTTVAAVFRVTVTRPPLAARVRGDSVLCAGSTATYTVVGATASAYRWTVRGGQVVGPATGRTAQVRWTSSGTVTVRALTPTGCYTDSVSHVVAVASGPVVTGPAVYCRTANTGLRYSIAGPAAAYQWRITNGSITSGQGTNTVLVDITPGATATLEVAATAACPTQLSIGLDDTCLAFYNIITPNGDNRNDVFVVENVERHPNTVLTVFNRWGRQVYHSPDYRNTFGGENTSAGMYYYRCQLADGGQYKGWFEIVK